MKGINMATLSTSFQSKEMTRFIRFSIVGLLGTLLDFSILTLLKLAGLPTLLANTFSFSVGLLNNFSLNRLWTFADVENTNWRKQFLQYATVSLIGLTINNILLLSLENIFSAFLHQSDWAFLPAKGIATGVVVFWNYFANKTWAFKRSPVSGLKS
jgi:putative flippase GtrA